MSRNVHFPKGESPVFLTPHDARLREGARVAMALSRPPDLIRALVEAGGWGEVLIDAAGIAEEGGFFELASVMRLLANDPRSIHKALGIPPAAPLCPCQKGDRAIVCACVEVDGITCHYCQSAPADLLSPQVGEPRCDQCHEDLLWGNS